MKTNSLYLVTTAICAAAALSLGLGGNPPCEKLDGNEDWLCSGCTSAPAFGTCSCVINEISGEGTCQSNTSPLTRCQKKEGVIPAVSGSIVVLEPTQCYLTYECKSAGPTDDCAGYGCVFKVTGGSSSTPDKPVQYESSTCDGQT